MNNNRNRMHSENKGKGRKDSRSNSKRGNGRNNQPADEKFTEDTPMKAEKEESKTNDAQWYMQAAALSESAANLNYSNIMGLKTGILTVEGINSDEVTTGQVIPGVLSLPIIPCYGKNNEYSSALNIASVAAYSFVRHANSGSRNYEHQDLMLYFLGAANVYAYINFLIRTYGLINLYVHDNRYYPRTLVQSAGVDFDELVYNIANFRYCISQLIAKASSFALPGNLPLFQREAWLYSGIYVEGASTKDQIYQYVPGGFLKFDLNTDGSGMMKYTPFLISESSTQEGFYELDLSAPEGGRDVRDLYQYGLNLIDSMLQQEDFGIMSGDILKAYGGENIIKLSDIPDNYQIIPSYDAEVLYQIKNSTPIYTGYMGPSVTGGSMAWKKWDVTQDVSRGILVTDYGFTVEGVASVATFNTNAELAKCIDDVLGGSFVNVTDRPEGATPEEVMTSTRLTAATKKSFGGNRWNVQLIAASEIIVNPFISWTVNGGGFSFATFGGQLPMNISLTTSNGLFSALSSFKYHPRVVLVNKGDGAHASTWMSFFDFDNYAANSPEVLDRIHEVALISMLQVPSVAKMQSSRAY